MKNRQPFKPPSAIEKSLKTVSIMTVDAAKPFTEASLILVK